MTQENAETYITPLNRSLRVFFKDAVRVAVKNPLQAYHFFRTVRWQQQAARLRANWKQEGIHVPPIAIFSITNRCNLHCKGCYHQALRGSAQSELSEERVRGIVREAEEMGISFIVFGGGEPFVRKEMLDITRAHPKMLFMVFTNGLLIDEAVAATLKKQRNLVPVISLEGHEADTDGRRGAGVHAHLQTVIKRVRNKGVFWGVSLTMTRGNFATLTDERFVGDLVKQGCKLFFFVEYSPVRKGTEGWVVTDEQRQSAARLMQRFRASYPALFISVPGDEDAFGGCLSAGRGFIHISAEGNLEPCPFAPYSDVNLRDMPLKEALRSEFLKRIRDSHRELSEAEGGCALWVKREWVRSLLREKQPAAAR